jgi:hypothetical protein
MGVASFLVLFVGMIAPRAVLPTAKAPTRLKILGIAAGLFVTAIAITPSRTQPAGGVAVKSGSEGISLPAAAAAPEPVPLPVTERAYIAAIHDAQAKYRDAANDLKRSSVYVDMMNAIHVAVPGGAASSWIGTIAGLGTNGDGNAWVEITIADDMTVKTWNNSFSDVQSHTLIANGSTVYRVLADLDKGTTVRFTAQLLALGDITEAGKVNSPEMIARFSVLQRVK